MALLLAVLHAATLFPMVVSGGASSNGDSSNGDISFKGGKRSPGCSPFAACSAA
jgi:hypothetical protein